MHTTITTLTSYNPTLKHSNYPFNAWLTSSCTCATITREEHLKYAVLCYENSMIVKHDLILLCLFLCNNKFFDVIADLVFPKMLTQSLVGPWHQSQLGFLATHQSAEWFSCTFFSRPVSHFFHFRAGPLTATHVGTAVVLLNKTPFVFPLSPCLLSLTLSLLD